MINIYYCNPSDRGLLVDKFVDIWTQYIHKYSLILFPEKGQYIEPIEIDSINTDGVVLRNFQNCNLQIWELIKLLTVPKNVLIFTDNSNELYSVSKIKQLLKACNIDDFKFHELKDSEITHSDKSNQLREYVKTNKSLLCDYAGFGHDIDFIDDLFNNKYINGKVQLIKKLLVFSMREAGLGNPEISKLIGYLDKSGACQAYKIYRETDVIYQSDMQKRIVTVVCDDIKYLFNGTHTL
jgi:hypothetical protein